MMVCQGDQSGGVELSNSAFTLLWVDSLTTEISPTGVAGIRFYSTAGGQMAVMSNTAPFGISTSGNDAPGIWVDSYVQRINSVAHFQSGETAVFSHDRITTTGANSYGIVVDAVTGISHSSENVESRGGNILVYSYGSVSTQGFDAVGIDVFNAISAGSSAAGGAAEAWGGDITINARDVRTHGDGATGIRVRQNISSNALAGSTGQGGSFFINNAGIVTTGGDGASGISATSFASVRGVDATAIGAAIRVESQDVETIGDNSAGISVLSHLMVEGYDTGEARSGEVSLASNGLISTYGDGSAGIVIAGIATANAQASVMNTARIGTMRVDNNGTIMTRGDGAHGIVIEQTAEADVGHGGGDAEAFVEAITVNSNEIRTTGNGSFGIRVETEVIADTFGTGRASTGKITVNSHNLSAAGDGSVGIFVQSSTGNNSPAGSADGGDIVVNSTGVLSAIGDGSIGISADSSGSGHNAVGGNITINILSGSVTGGSGSGAGVRMANGANNILANYGTISALSGMAIVGSAGNTTVDNYGRVIGDVNLFGGTQVFNNHATGVFETGDFVALGMGVTRNAGLLSPGGVGEIKHTTVVGGFEQTGTGRYAVDIDFANGGTDYVLVMPGSGPVSLAGLVVPNVVDAGGPVRQFLILSAADGIIDDGLDVVDTAVVDYSLTFDPGVSGVYLGAVLDFAPRGLNRNQTSIGDYINAAVAADSGLETEDLLGLRTVADLGAAYDQLSPEVYGQLQSAGLFAAEQFAGELMSCRVAGGPNAAIREGECLWARARATDRDVNSTSSNVGSNSRVGSFSAGLQVAMAADWRLGVGVGYDIVSHSTSSGATVDGERANVGAVVKYNPGPLLFAAGVAAGWGDFDTDRAIAFGGFAATASSSSTTDYVSGWLHAAYLAERGGWYVKPLVDLRVTELDFSGARETGGVGLTVAGARDTVFSVSPAIEVGTEFRFDALAIWRPFLRAGVTWRDSDEFSTVASFAGVPAGVPSFAVATGMDDVLLDVAAGVDVIDTEGVAMRVQYDGRFGAESSQNSFSLKGSVPF